MTSVFPSLLSWSELSPLLIRLVLGAALLYSGYRVIRNNSSMRNAKIASVIEILAGILLVIGLYSQIAALAVIIDLLIRIGDRIHKKAFLTDGVNYYLILLVLAISIMVTGAGLLGFDYRL